MKKLSEFRGEEALDILADLIEPAVEIIGDEDVKVNFRAKKPAKAVKYAIKNHKRAVLEILAALEGEDPDEYKPGIFALPMKLLEVFNDPELVNLFMLQDQSEEQTISGSALVNTGATEE